MTRFIVWMFVTTVSLCAENMEIDVWPAGKVPGKVTSEPESEIKRQDGFKRITNVSQPTLTLFLVDSTKQDPGPVLIVCPGGGYRYTVLDKEGSEIAERFNKVGVSALVLKYRSPQNREGALQDVQRTIRLIRANASQWNVNPEKIGVIGFSAGGHLAARASNQFTTRSYTEIDHVDAFSCRPDFAILVYPAFLDNKQGGVSANLDLNADIAPTLIVHSEDDKTHVVGSKIYSTALKKAGKNHTFKLYATGGHGYGLRSQGDARIWPGDAVAWMKEMGMLNTD